MKRARVTPYTALVLAVAGERVAELVVARRNLAWSRARGGREIGFGHYPVMVALHSGLLAGSLAEVRFGRRRFIPALGWPMVGAVLASQALRWWCIRTLGPQWNTRIVVVPGLPRVTGGPYRVLPHPNYVAVATEGVALPLAGSAWLTSIAFTAANALLMRVRVRAESEALAVLDAPAGPA